MSAALDFFALLRATGLFYCSWEMDERGRAADFFFQRNKNAEWAMTNTEPALCTNAPSTGLSVPDMASRMAAKFSAMEKAILYWMARIILWESR